MSAIPETDIDTGIKNPILRPLPINERILNLTEAITALALETREALFQTTFTFKPMSEEEVTLLASKQVAILALVQSIEGIAQSIDTYTYQRQEIAEPGARAATPTLPPN